MGYYKLKIEKNSRVQGKLVFFKKNVSKTKEPRNQKQSLWLNSKREKKGEVVKKIFIQKVIIKIK